MVCRMRFILPLLISLVATPALADPCKAIPDRGALPPYLRAGAAFSGPVTYVGDGDGLCVAVVSGRERDPSTWVEVRVADYYAPELSDPGGGAAKSALSRLVMGKRLSCVAQKRSYDRIVAVCKLHGKSVGDLMRARGVAEGGNGRARR